MSKRPVLASTLVAATLVLATGLPSLAASNICTFQAYSDDSDPAGTNLRSGPSTDHDVIGVFKAVRDSEGYVWSPEFAVTAFKAGWFKIGDAKMRDYGDFPPVQVFAGPGWVSAKLVEFEIEDRNMREAPSLDAKVTLEMVSDTPWYLDNISVTTIHGCDAGFLDVTITNAAGQTKRGWVTDLCANQATTCS
jgi:hypothetical protein